MVLRSPGHQNFNHFRGSFSEPFPVVTLVDFWSIWEVPGGPIWEPIGALFPVQKKVEQKVMQLDAGPRATTQDIPGQTLREVIPGAEGKSSA